MVWDFCKALAIAAAIAAQICFLGPLNAVGADPNGSISASSALPPLFVIAICATVALTAFFWVAFRMHWHRLVAVSVILGLWLYVAFYGLMPDFGPFDGRRLDFENYRLLGWTELVAVAAGVTLALLFPRKISRATWVLLVYSAVNGTQVIAAADWSKQVTRGTEEAAGDLTSSNDFTTSAERTLGTPVFSPDKNILIVIMDTFQNDVFEEIVDTESGVADAMSGFTFFTNATGHFPFTKLSIAAILRGKVYDGDGSISSYLEATNDKRLPAVLAGQGYEVDLLPLHSRGLFLSGAVSACRSYAELTDIYIFRQAPLLLKELVYDDGRFLFARRCSGGVPVTEQEQDLAVLEQISDTLSVGRSSPTFKWLHLWGMHPPARLNSECGTIESRFDAASIKAQARCILGRFEKVLGKMKDEGVYDNTQIYLVADHGTLLGLLKDRGSDIPAAVRSSAHPTIAFKDFDSKGKLRKSAAPVTLKDIYGQALASAGMEPAGEVLKSIEVGEPRRRRFTFFKSAEEASQEHLSRTDVFTISGDVRDPEAWTTAEGNTTERPLQRVDFGTAEALAFANVAFSTEAKGIGASWVLSSPASVSGLLPNVEHITVSARFLSPHINQRVAVSVNGRKAADWKATSVNGWDVYEADVTLAPEERGQPGKISFEVSKIIPLADPSRPLGIFVDWIEVEAAE